MDDWTNNDAYRAIPQMEHGNPVQVIDGKDVSVNI